MALNTLYARTIALSVAVSYIGFIVFSYCLIEWNIAESDFFTVDFTTTDKRPKLLDMPIETKSQFTWIAVFFFFNAFMSEWNGVVINSIFTKMECGTGSGTTFHGRQRLLFALFTVYDIWCGVRAFFGILGLTANYVWMIATIGGGLSASLVTKFMYIHNAEYDAVHGGGDWAQYIKEVPRGARPEKPLGKAPFAPLQLGALVRARTVDATRYSRI
jgi:hypothetical protein